METSIEEEISEIKMGKPHVVILGAGASLAAFPNGDKNGVRLPLMNNLVELVGLKSLFSGTGVYDEDLGFEELYGRLCSDDAYADLRVFIEGAIHRYFSRLTPGDEPTIYDHLVLSLRDKDVIATFNWDPFLQIAYQRNCDRLSLPRLLFLHGNVTIGSCEKDEVVGVNGHLCSKCGSPFVSSKLLYPVEEKNYTDNPFIANQWSELAQHLKNAFMITVFGYGAPKSDIGAIELMKAAWGDSQDRVLEQTEIIDVRDEESLRDLWSPFICSHHYEIHANFNDSWIANHPRRTGEAYLNQFIEAKWVSLNPIPPGLSRNELHDWFAKFGAAENVRPAER